MLRTKSGLPKHCSWNTDQRGGRFVRFRLRGFSTYLSGIPWGEDFMRQYAAALKCVKAQAAEIGSARTKPGSFNYLCVAYYKSPEFRGLKASTQAARRNIIERFRVEHGDKPIAKLGRAHIANIIGARAETPEAANGLLKVLRVLLKYAVDIDMIAANPAASVKRYRSKGDGFHTWSEEEIARFQARHPLGSRAHLALALMLHTAARKGDAIRLGWQNVRGDMIAMRQQKTSTTLVVPIHPELAAALASAPKTNMTFLITEHGAPFTAAGFGNWFRRECDRAGLPHCSAHGLRKAAATRLANAGCTAEQIKAITGHKTLAQVGHYTRQADQERLARQALTVQLGAESNRNCPAA